MPTRALAAATLAHALGDWVALDGPRYQRLAAAVTAAAERGALATGSVLPPERALASHLALSRGTVVAAYDLLRDAGVVERRQGSGTRITHGAGGGSTEESAAGLRAQGLTGRLFHPTDAVVDLGISLLPDAGGLPADAFALDPHALAGLAEGHGYHPLGLPALRTALAALHTAEGLPTDAAQIAVTSGAQHAIALVSRLLVGAGDVVAVESPTYPGAIDAFARAGARFVTYASDSGGARPDDVRRVIGSQAPQLVYVVPSAQNPTGTVLPDTRRRDLARLAAEADTWLLEDESLRWTVFDRPAPPPPIATFGGGDRVVTVGSFSKVLWGGLRVGWLRAPEPLVARLGRLKAADDLGTSAVSQAIAVGLLPRLAEVAAHRRAQLAAGADQLMTGLADRLPDWTFRPPDGGLSLWVKLPRGTGDGFAQAALAHGVGVLPGSAACVDETDLDHIRLSFALPPDRLGQGIERLAATWTADAAGTTRRARRPSTPLG